jgi:hypothetical protein
MTTDLVRLPDNTAFVRDSQLATRLSEDELMAPYNALKKHGVVLREPRTDGKFWFPVPEPRTRRDNTFAKVSFSSAAATMCGSITLASLMVNGLLPESDLLTSVTYMSMLAPMFLMLPGFFFTFGTTVRQANELGLRAWFLGHGVRISGQAAYELQGKLRSLKSSKVAVVDNDGVRHEVLKEFVDGVPVFSLAAASTVSTVKSIEAAVVPFAVPKGVLSGKAMRVVSRIQVLGERLAGLTLSVEMGHVVERAEADVQELVDIRSRMIRLNPKAVEGAAVLSTLLRIEAELAGVVEDCVEGLDRELRVQNTYVVNR